MSEDKKAGPEMKLSLSEEKNLGFLEAMSKTNTEKITKEILEGLSEDTDDRLNCSTKCELPRAKVMSEVSISWRRRSPSARLALLSEASLA